MNNKGAAQILASYEKIAPHVDQMVAGFYERLFTAAPGVRSLFQADMSLQRSHLSATLAMLVRNLAFQDLLDESLMDLGAQHLIWGARPEHYTSVRDCLLASLGDTLKDAWTPELQSYWTALLDHVVATMLKGSTRYALNLASKPNRL